MKRRNTRLASSKQDSTDTSCVRSHKNDIDARASLNEQVTSHEYPRRVFKEIPDHTAPSKVARKYELVPETEPVHRKQKLDNLRYPDSTCLN